MTLKVMILRLKIYIEDKEMTLKDIWPTSKDKKVKKFRQKSPFPENSPDEILETVY